MLQTTLERQIGLTAANHSSTAATRVLLGCAKARAGQLAAARALWAEAEPLLAQSLGTAHPFTQVARAYLALADGRVLPAADRDAVRQQVGSQADAPRWLDWLAQPPSPCHGSSSPWSSSDSNESPTMNPLLRTLARRLLLAAVASTAAGVCAQTPAAGTPGNPSAPLQCWELLPCPAGTSCGPSGVGMSQKLGGALPAAGVVQGGAYSPLLSGPVGTSPRVINNNLAVADLRMLAPAVLSAIKISSMTSTIYRGGLLTNDVGQQLRIDFASGSLPAVAQVAQFPLAPSVQGGNWLLTMDVQGRIPAWWPKKGTVAASFRVACSLPVFVEQFQTQGF